ncbi:MAG TPA: methyltransferase domain-containing protein [Acidobacteriaceae bacterium]|nr:methyltransferase domain-containing protein [Acidobacteriaceae bacterium]
MRSPDFPVRLTGMTFRKFATILFAAALGCAPSLQAQTSAPASHPTSTPYAGDLRIFEDPGRAQRLQVDRVMDLLGLKPGSTVADIGAGGGWFSVRAARRVAPNGHLIAEDINPKAIAYIRQRAEHEHLADVEAVLGTPDDPKLAPDSLDAALMLKVYHEIAHPELVLARLNAALRPGARFGIIDRNGNGADHGLNEPVVRAEVERAGFRQVARYDFTKADGQDYFLIFEKQTPEP